MSDNSKKEKVTLRDITNHPGFGLIFAALTFVGTVAAIISLSTSQRLLLFIICTSCFILCAIVYASLRSPRVANVAMIFLSILIVITALFAIISFASYI